jgi:hypothetical protein
MFVAQRSTHINGTTCRLRPSFGSHWMRSLFLLAEHDASFETRGFAAANPTVRQRLERIGETFINGFNCGLMDDQENAWCRCCATVQSELRGFAVEGIAMGVAVADALTFGTRLARWMAQSEAKYTYLTHVGAGWALARVPWRRATICRSLDPIHSWLVYDGLGFHDAYFHPRRVLANWRRIRRGYAARAYEQGVGRALWFVSGGDPSRATLFVLAQAPGRRRDLWSGIGLALAYAGGASKSGLAEILEAAGPLRSYLAQGAAFASEACSRAGHTPCHTAQAVKILTGVDHEDAAHLVRSQRPSHALDSCDPFPPYELWRARVRHSLQRRAETHSSKAEVDHQNVFHRNASRAVGQPR